MRVQVVILCSVGLVEESIVGDIFHNIRVVDHRSMVCMRHRQWEMLDRVLLRFMQR